MAGYPTFVNAFAESQAGLRPRPRNGVLTPRRAARMRCLDCRESSCEIAACELGPKATKPCPLHFIRYGPHKRDHGGSSLKAIRRYCLWCMCDQPVLVRECDQEESCPLWPYRMGHRPETVARRTEEGGDPR